MGMLMPMLFDLNFAIVRHELRWMVTTSYWWHAVSYVFLGMLVVQLILQLVFPAPTPRATAILCSKLDVAAQHIRNFSL
jgi:hypothetical protein